MSEMKDSGVAWLGDIPSTWAIHRVKHAFTRKNKKAMQEDPVILSLARSGVKIRDVSNNEGQIAESYYNYNPVDVNDLLINPMDLYSGANCSISKVTGVISPAYINLKSNKDVNPIFYDYYFKLQYWMMAFFAYGKGVSYENRWTLNVETLMNYPIVALPYAEQCRSADYLDNKCGKIDAIIAREQAVIEKLNAYKLSVVNEHLTEVNGTRCHIGFLGVMKNGLNFSDSAEGEKYKFLGVGDFKDFFILNNEEMFSSIRTNDSISDDYYLRNGDIVFVRSNGSKALVGRSVMVENIDYPLTYSGFCIRFRNSRPDIVNTHYLLYFFRSPYFRKSLEKYSQGSNISNMNQDLLSRIEITFPDINEQLRIVSFLKEKIHKIDSAITRKQAVIYKLTEYKKSLIYEVVTGKKEV